MQLNSVIGASTYVASTTYDSAGRMDIRSFGNTTQTNYDYYAWNAQGGRLQTIKSGTSGSPTSLQNLTYTYDAVGNVSTIVDSLAGPQTQTFGYDSLNRLTSAVGTGGANGTYNNTFSYDAATGNLKTKAGQTYTYDTVHAHAVASQTNGNNYQYDANGNMTHRVDGADVYDLAYDAENHMTQVTKNGSVYATFTYDGNGQRVIAAVSGFLTRRFVGQYYEYRSSTNSAKTYFAGAQQVAMNDSGVLTYLLGDHLGSTSITTNASGAVTSEIRYYPFGSTRYYTPSSLPTRYRFTGQYSYTPDFGLYYYGSRWYDPVLGRFTSADTIVPGGVQGLDRYAYVNNNPVRYTDPSGHIISCEAEEDCKEVRRTDKLTASDAWDEMFSKYGVTVKGSWDIRYKIALGLGISAVAEKFSDIAQQSPSDIFKQIYGQLTFTWGNCNECNGKGGYTYGISDIRFASMAAFYHSNWLLRATNNVIHELGHAFNWAMGQNPELLLAHDMNRYKTGFNELLNRSSDPNSYSGFASRNNERVWVQNPATTASEVFADQFLGWVSNTWQQSPNNRYGVWSDAGTARANWMTTNMTGFLSAYR